MVQDQDARSFRAPARIGAPRSLAAQKELAREDKLHPRRLRGLVWRRNAKALRLI